LPFATFRGNNPHLTGDIASHKKQWCVTIGWAKGRKEYVASISGNRKEWNHVSYFCAVLIIFHGSDIEYSFMLGRIILVSFIVTVGWCDTTISRRETFPPVKPVQMCADKTFLVFVLQSRDGRDILDVT
jgi:hypothetical protein